MTLEERVAALEAQVAELLANKRSTFKPPLPQDVIAFIECQVVKHNRGQVWTSEVIRDVASTFYLYYESNGWMVGRTKMKKWDKALLRWMNQENQKLKQKHGQATTSQQSAIEQFINSRTNN
jgi:hypothetical protein